MIKGFVRRAEATILAVSLVASSLVMPVPGIGETVQVFAEEGGDEGEEDTTPAVITLTPFENQWKYYGQPKQFVNNEHYALSEEEVFGGWTLILESEEPGMQNFRIDGTTEDEDGRKIQLAETAPQFEIRNYTALATATVDSEYLMNDYITTTDTDEVTIQAPEDYLIRGEKSGGWDLSNDIENGWSDELEPDTLQEGINEITYYLRSNAKDSTRKAIDLTPKKLTLNVDSIAPQITTLAFTDNTDVTAQITIAGSESSIYYYMVLPVGYFEDEEYTPDPEEVWKNVTAGIGIVGKGRLEGTQEVTINIDHLSSETEYKIYAYLEDKAGNKSEVGTSESIETDKLLLSGKVAISGTPAVGNTLTATPALTSVDSGALNYQWYRIKVAEDEAALNAVYDTTGSTDADDLEDEDEDDADEDDEDDEDDAESNGADDTGDASEDVFQPESIDGAEPIHGATTNTYKITKQDIGYRLIVSVTAENYSGNVMAETTTFVPKLIPTYTVPAVSIREYSPGKKLSSVLLPKQWSWVNSEIVPAYGNSGYPAKFVPADTKTYKTMVVYVKVPITKRLLKKSMMRISDEKAYTGKAIKGNFKIVDKKRLQENKDYKVSYKNNKNLGKATISVRGTGNYKGSFKVNYEIVRKSINNLTIKCSKRKLYNGKKRKISLTLKNDNVTLKKDRDYKVEYKNNTNIGKAKVIIRGVGNYKGKKVLSFSIVPNKPVIKKIKGKNSSISMTIKNIPEAKGYYVEVSKTNTFYEAYTSQYMIDGNSFSIRSLPAGTYYVRVRAYAKSKGKEYTSSYSKIKKVTLK